MGLASTAVVRNDPFGAQARPLVDDEQRPVDSGPGKVVGAVLAELLAQRVVELLEAGLPRLDPTQILAAIVAVLGAAGLVSVRHFPLGGRDRLALLVAEPLPRGQVSVGVELAGADEQLETLVPRLRRHAEHPAVDALVVVGTGPSLRDLPRQIDGVPVRSVVLHSWGETSARPLPPVCPPA
jgi:hypothetical protein